MNGVPTSSQTPSIVHRPLAVQPRTLLTSMNSTIAARGAAPDDQRLGRQVLRANSGASCSPGTSLQVSVVIATYNRAESLGRLLIDLTDQALAALHPSEVEILVVDDGGNHDVASVLPARSPFDLTLVTQANGGPAVARHAGIASSTGAVVIVLDDDMRIGPGFVQAHLDAHVAGADVVYGLIEGDKGKGPLFARYHQMHIDRWLDECRAGAAPRGDRLCTGNVSFSRNAYVSVGGFDPNLIRCEDRDLGIRLEQAGYRFTYCESALSTHESGIHDRSDWRRRNEIYGESDVVISAKHAQRAALSPWAFLAELPTVVHPLLIAVAAFPVLSRPLGAVVYRVGERFDRAGMDSVAMRLAGLTYGVDYYGGAGRRWGSTRRAVAALTEWRSSRAGFSEATP